MRSEFVTRTQTLLLHEDADGVRPTSGLELLTMGSFAVAYSLRGAGFYKLLEESGLEPFRQIGVDTVLAAVSPVHLRAMRQRLKGATVQELQAINVGGKPMCLVVIQRRTQKLGEQPKPTTL
jgi:hypothetical protein